MRENLISLPADVMEYGLITTILKDVNQNQILKTEKNYSTIQLLKTNTPPTKDNKVITYKVSKDDTLIKIAKKYNTNWKRLWDKNTKLKHPDKIDVGVKLVIPDSKEKLKDRKVPARSVNKIITTTNSQRSAIATSAPKTIAGNLYTYGYCTWYVKNLRPDLPNNLGNANTWLYMASGQGFATGSKPQVGAVAWSGAGALGHVAYVTEVNGDIVTVTEMNYKGWGVASSRVTHASEFQYIY